jgi:flagellar protein FlaG
MEIFADIQNIQQQDWSQNIQQINGKGEDDIHTKKPEEIQQIEQTQKEKEEEELHKEKEEMTKEKLQELTAKLNKEMSPLNPDIEFQFNDKVDELVVNVMDKQTNKIIRKIPSDEALKIMEKMRELVGALFDDKG